LAGRRIVDRSEAVRSLEAAAASGLGRAVWARRNGIDGRSLNAWRLNLERRADDDVVNVPAIRMVELVASTPAVATYRIRCGAFVVEVDGNFDDHVLARLLSVVASC